MTNQSVRQIFFISELTIVKKITIALLPWTSLGYDQDRRRSSRSTASLIRNLAPVQIVQAVQWFGRSRSLTAGFLDGLQFRALRGITMTGSVISLVLRFIEEFAPFKPLKTWSWT